MDSGVMKWVYVIIGFVIAIYLIGNLLPGAISSITGATTTGWSSSLQNIWLVLPILIVAGVLIMVVGIAITNKGGKG